ncbi:MAG: 3-oxoacyl-[acyl-carrier-protein] reductase [Sphingobacteriales bacterium]|jgi:3-oxoacyl-[acyl-carrier protein] reductase|nr:3-oxoacyl-[acyl-carrier-protein] reductase [Sphingobacteriales bacterium]MCC7223054.1 3-oxoacyl-[acyl-carrier-protein] reductase [Chitinophagales bacterium]
MLLAHKTALVTGGTRGIGRAIVARFAAEGASVAFSYVSESSADLARDLCAQLTAQYDVTIRAFRADGSRYDEAENLVRRVGDEMGGIHILVNNAGITRDNLLLRLSEAQWDEVLDNNLKSVFHLCKHSSRYMLKQRQGSIINIGSIIGLRGNAGQANYAASKAGMIGFSKSVAQELGSRNIRCNVISPGFIDTEMTQALPEATRTEYSNGIPLKRFGTGDEVAQVALFLASDLSAYVTGQTISVCGGLYR